MILYCAADKNYFNNYFELWATQCNRYYPELRKIIALHGPDEETFEKCERYNIEYRDITEWFPENPQRKHFYLLRWLFLPFDLKDDILETQINCLPILKQKFENITCEQYRISRLKKGGGRPRNGVLGGVSAAVFKPEAAEKVVMQARKMIDNPPESDHEMNMWQIYNLSHQMVKSEQQFKQLNMSIDDETCWITAGTSQALSVNEKLEILRHYIK